MKRLKKLLLLCFVLFNLLSCGKPQDDSKIFDKEKLTIAYDDKIFSLLESEYYILFYSPKCKACLDTLKFIEYKYNEKNFDIYLINILESTVAYDKQNITNLNCNSIEDFYLFKTPYLITIFQECIVSEVGGFNEIRTYLK